MPLSKTIRLAEVIDARLKQKNQLLEREVVYTPEMVEASSRMCWLKDHKGVMVAISKPYSRYFSVPLESYKGHRDQEIHGKHDGSNYQDVDRVVGQNCLGVIISEEWTNGNGDRERGHVLKKHQRMKGGFVWTYGTIFEDTIETIPNEQYDR